MKRCSTPKQTHHLGLHLSMQDYELPYDRTVVFLGNYFQNTVGTAPHFSNEAFCVFQSVQASLNMPKALHYRGSPNSIP